MKASTSHKTSDETSSHQLLTFHIQDEIFAFDISIVSEIVQHKDISVVPMRPSFVRGVVSLRGHILPVIDLKARLGQGRSEIMPKTCLIVINVPLDKSTTELGIMVDSAHDIIEITNEQRLDTPAFGTEVQTKFVAGMVRRDHKFVTILDSKTTFNIEDMANCTQ